VPEGWELLPKVKPLNEAALTGPDRLILVTLPDTFQVQDEAGSLSLAGNLSTSKPIDGPVRTINKNLATRRVDQPTKLRSIRKPIRHFALKLFERICLGA
jgi:hypothetical protein